MSADNFYRNPTMSNGYLSSCKACVTEKNKTYRAANIEAVKKRTAAYAARNAAQCKATRAAWRKRNREKSRAHYAVGNALRKGILVNPGVCSQCGVEGRIEAHHPDYSKPLEVV